MNTGHVGSAVVDVGSTVVFDDELVATPTVRAPVSVTLGLEVAVVAAMLVDSVVVFVVPKSDLGPQPRTTQQNRLEVRKMRGHGVLYAFGDKVS
jgi:hypothetical protein